jgi:hypothetical protein
MRDAINSYASLVAGTGSGGSNPVWRLPQYLPAPPVTLAELAAATPGPLRLRSAVSAPLDSLQALPSPVSDGDESDEYAGDWQPSLRPPLGFSPCGR